jgi:two-component system NarL family sensor kinase
MKINTSIVKKLVIYFLLLNIFTVIVIGSYSYYRAKDALVERTFDQLTSVRIEKKYRVERFFEDRIQDVNLVSKSGDVGNIIQLMNSNYKAANLEKLIFNEYDKFLRKHFSPGQYYKRIFVCNNYGRKVEFKIFQNDSVNQSISNLKNSSIEKLYHSILTKPDIVIEDYKLDEKNNSPAIFIGAPIISQKGLVKGVIIIEINIEAINSIMFENNPHNGLGKSGESYLVGSDYLMRSTSRFQDNSVFKTKVQTSGVKEALEGNTGTEIILDYRNIAVLSSFSNVNLQGLNWAILAEIDEKEAMIPINSIRNNITYLSILISLLLFAFVYIIARRISLPIVKLKNAAQNITKGNYDVFVKDIESSDEIGSLIDAFNEMSSKIKEQTENLKLERSMRLSSMIDGQELERQRLSRELHDGLGQSILAIKMRLQRMKNANPEKAHNIMEEVEQLFSNTINEVRSISNNLMPAVLNEFGLVDALNNLCKDVVKSTGIQIVFKSKKFAYKIDDKLNTYLYRISQEALNNIIKHSEANSALVELSSKKDNVYLKISDNGKGFKYADDRKLCGNGISNMKERVHLLNGDIYIESNKKSGTEIQIVIPIKH